MKLKCQPEDFEVEEVTSVTAGEGPFALYRLTKRSLGTPEAITACVQRWQLSRRHVSWGGLKDRHALTSQYVTILNGPRKDLRQEHLDLRYLGQTQDPFTPAQIDANRFRITLRDLSPREAAWIEQHATPLLTCGVPNYFDDQRFGSVGYSREFIAAPWCREDYERALWLAIAEANPHDRPGERREKEALRDHWGDWPRCRAALERSNRRSIITFLCDHPHDFKRAIALVPADLRSLYVAAFQSYLWNLILTAWLRQHWSADELVALEIDRRENVQQERLFPLVPPPAEPPGLAETELPLPSARLRLEPGDAWYDLYTHTLAQVGWTLPEIKLKHPRDTFFSKGERTAILVPRDFRCTLAEDDLYPGQQRAVVDFTLGRGAYATMLIKRLQTALASASV